MLKYFLLKEKYNKKYNSLKIIFNYYFYKKLKEINITAKKLKKRFIKLNKRSMNKKEERYLDVFIKYCDKLNKTILIIGYNFLEKDEIGSIDLITGSKNEYSIYIFSVIDSLCFNTFTKRYLIQKVFKKYGKAFEKEFEKKVSKIVICDIPRNKIIEKSYEI